MIIVGLGNPEKEFKGTRHNVGFEVVNKIAFDNNIPINKAKFRAHIGEGLINGKKVMLVKPQTYMNRSGESVRDILAFYKKTPEDVVIIYDDVALHLGDIRMRQNGSGGGHNGMNNIIYQLETQDFLRIRVGIGQKPSGWELNDYVLGRFLPKDMEAIVEGITKASDAAEMLLKTSPTDVMNKYNRKQCSLEDLN